MKIHLVTFDASRADKRSRCNAISASHVEVWKKDIKVQWENLNFSYHITRTYLNIAISLSTVRLLYLGCLIEYSIFICTSLPSCIFILCSPRITNSFFRTQWLAAHGICKLHISSILHRVKLFACAINTCQNPSGTHECATAERLFMAIQYCNLPRPLWSR